MYVGDADGYAVAATGISDPGGIFAEPGLANAGGKLTDAGGGLTDDGGGFVGSSEFLAEKSETIGLTEVGLF